MPISPDDVRNQQSTNVPYQDIDSQLIAHGNGDWYDAYSFAILPRELNEKEKGEVIRKYTFSGWEHVTVHNSSENERPGMCEIRCYYKKPQNV